MMFGLLRLVSVGGLAMGATLGWAAQEHVINGDFSQGNTGFMSDYKDYYTDQANCFSAGPRMMQSCYAITDDPFSVHVGGYHGPLGSHGNVMVVNGSALKVIWMQEVQIKAGNVYRWSASAASNVTNATIGGDPAPAVLDLQLATAPGSCTTAGSGFETVASIATTKNGLPADLPSGPYTAPNWVSAQGTTTRAQDGLYCLRIYDTVGTAAGNDFMMDDLSFVDITPPTPVAVPSLDAIGLLALSGALGWLGLRRRRQTGTGVR